MFTKGYCDEINEYFNRQMELLQNRAGQLKQEKESHEAEGTPNEFFGLSLSLLERKIAEINRTIKECSEDEAEALRFLYSAMPVSDMIDYPASVYLAYARHAVFLWKEGPYAGTVPEKIFANYVLHHRINNEDMTDTRAFFYEKLVGRIAGMTMEDAAMEANVWCAEEGTYHMTDRRDQNPITMYRTGIGRCGEESIFAITVLRSLGIPARQVYVPLWAHCDSNHAWVEAWCDGKWRFFGACEPDEKLDMGWFVGPATRAMQVSSVWYGKDEPLDQVVGQKGTYSVVNHLDNYAKKGVLKVRVEKENGEPVPGAKVEFKVLNGGFFGNVATLTTGSDPDKNFGEAVLFAGFGSLQVCAFADGLYGEEIVRLTDRGDSGSGSVTEAVVVIRSNLPQLNEWREFQFYAPREAVRDEQITQEQMEAQNARLKDQANKRKMKTEHFYLAREGERVLGRFTAKDREAVKEILIKAHGNLDEIVRFLDWDFTGLVPELEQEGDAEHWKLEALRALGEKDYWDIRADVLFDSCICAAPYAAQYPADIFYPFLLAPRVADEMLSPYRQAILKSISPNLQDEIRKNPETLPKMLKSLMTSAPGQDFGGLLTSPIGALTGGIGNAFSRAVLCVKIYRALGIPARPRMIDRTVEYYRDGAFHSIRRELLFGSYKNVTAGEAANEENGTNAKARLILHGKGGLKFSDWEHYSVSRFEDGRFMFLFLGGPGRMPQGETLEAELGPGIYRAVTTNRLPTGDQYVRVCDFSLSGEEEKNLDMELCDYPARALCSQYSVNDYVFETPEGDKTSLSSLAVSEKCAFIWLQVGKEPTEHVLNELLARKQEIAQMDRSIYLIAASSGDYSDNETLKHVTEELPMLRLLVCDSPESYKELSISIGQNPGNLPLAFVMQGGENCIYSDGGYKVGMVEFLLRVLND